MSDHGIIALLCVLPLAICGSAFFSGTETVLFGLTADDRWQIQRDHKAAAAMIDRLLAHPRRLLLTLLMGNMTVNSIWFAIGTVAVADAHLSVWVSAALGIVQVVALVVMGEVVPKIVGNTMRRRMAPLVARPALLVYRLVTPVRAVVERLIFEPLNAISRKALAEAASTPEEIGEVVRAAGLRADISQDEAALFGRLVHLKRKRVRDVMTHRTQVALVNRLAKRDEVLAVAFKTRLKRLPVIERNLDAVVGILDVRGFLLDTRGDATPLDAHIVPAQFVPEIASIDQLLDLFKARKSSLMIAVDEHGGTAGIVALEDAVEEIVGDIVAHGEASPAEPATLDDGSWRVDGSMSAEAFCSHFRVPASRTRASTVAGIVVEVLGRLPECGESFGFGSLRIRVGRTEDGLAAEVIVERVLSQNDSEVGDA